ncbi:hypothetical protein ACHAXR_002199 [Thalassiosira sp. AJA248-18]
MKPMVTSAFMTFGSVAASACLMFASLTLTPTATGISPPAKVLADHEKEKKGKYLKFATRSCGKTSPP